MIKVHVAGHILMRGKGLNDKVEFRQYVCGKLRRGTEREFKVGDIIVAKDTCNEMMEQFVCPPD